MIHLYTGDGKGKTTAAIGLAIRMAGTGKRVLFAQFMKGRDTAELRTLSRIPEISIFRNPEDLGFVSGMDDAEKKQMEEWHNETLEAIFARAVSDPEGTGLIVLDEVTYVVSMHLIDEKRLLELLDFCRIHRIEVVMTGQKPPESLLIRADYITEMKKIRHPFDRGVMAREGIEY